MKSKQAKTPELTTKTKLLSFDLETNGLHGKAFAVGAVLISYDGTIATAFTARCELDEAIDPWVEKNVLPAVADMPITHANHAELREAFWRWYIENEPKADYVLVNNGYPVEYRFLLECQEANLDERYWQHPFPILDVASLLLQVGQGAQASKSQLAAGLIESEGFKLHNPKDDAVLAAKIAFRAFELSGRIQTD